MRCGCGCGALRGGRAVSGRRADSLVRLCAEKKKGQTKHTEVDLYQSDRSQTARHVSRSVTGTRAHARPRTHLLSPKHEHPHTQASRSAFTGIQLFKKIFLFIFDCFFHFGEAKSRIAFGSNAHPDLGMTPRSRRHHPAAVTFSPQMPCCSPPLPPSSWCRPHPR